MYHRMFYVSFVDIYASTSYIILRYVGLPSIQYSLILTLHLLRIVWDIKQIKLGSLENVVVIEILTKPMFVPLRA